MSKFSRARYASRYNIEASRGGVPGGLGDLAGKDKDFLDRYELELHGRRGVAGLGQPPITRDVINALPMPVETGPARAELPIWLYPPINWENLDQIAYTVIGAIGTEVVIISFVVPIGRNGVINKVANNFVGGGWTEGTGDILWRILIDGAPPPGANSYAAIPASLGSPAQPVGIAGFRVYENQTVQVTALNNPAGPNGGVVVAGQRVGARLAGYFYPREKEDADIWI